MTDTRERIETVINRLRPLLQADGVDIELVEVRHNGASLRLTGCCVRRGTAARNVHAAREAMLVRTSKDLAQLATHDDGTQEVGMEDDEVERWQHEPTSAATERSKSRCREFTKDGPSSTSIPRASMQRFKCPR